MHEGCIDPKQDGETTRVGVGLVSKDDGDGASCILPVPKGQGQEASLNPL